MCQVSLAFQFVCGDEIENMRVKFSEEVGEKILPDLLYAEDPLLYGGSEINQSGMTEYFDRGF